MKVSTGFICGLIVCTLVVLIVHFKTDKQYYYIEFDSCGNDGKAYFEMADYNSIDDAKEKIENSIDCKHISITKVKQISKNQYDSLKNHW